MDAPIPTIETVENAYERTTEQIEALKAHKPKTQAEQRRRATEMARLGQVQIDLAKEVIRKTPRSALRRPLARTMRSRPTRRG